MKYRLTGLLFLSAFFLLDKLAAQELPPPVKNDSITLAQAFINLTLTKEYFEGLSEDRVEKILSFEMTELTGITDEQFLSDNSGLYNFSYALLYYNEAKFLYRTKKISSQRAELIQWKESLEKSIDYYNLAKTNSNWSQEIPFFELINYTESSYSSLHRELFTLKSLFTPYFNEDIYPDFQRIFLKAKQANLFEIDSLAYFAGLYELEYSASIIDKKYIGYNYNFGPNTLPLVSEYNHVERDYDYYPYTDPIQTAYLLDEKLDLISRYVQLKSLASNRNTDKLSWFESYRMYNDYYIFKDASLDKLFINKITKIEDPFLKTELDSTELDVLYAGLRKKFSYASYATAQAFINLTLTQAQFENQSPSQIASVLASNELELSSVEDSSFIAQNHQLYNFTYSLLYENTARLLYRTRKNIARTRLIKWKETLEKGIDSYNLSQDESNKSEEDLRFNELIKFDGNDKQKQQSNILDLKEDFTPYFNEDIYPDFQRIFYKAKNSDEYDFEGLKAFAGIYNVRLDLSVLQNKRYISEYPEFEMVIQSYEMLRKLDLVSKFIQFKFLASRQFTISQTGFDLDFLYESYNTFLYALEHEEDAFILRELNEEATEILFDQLQEKFPYHFERAMVDADGIYDSVDKELAYPESELGEGIYFFPELAPLASARFIKPNFKPELKTLGKVDEFLRREFISAGYKDQLHYYYASDGFAITTSLERFNLDGSTVATDKRFVKSLTEQNKLSYYDIFKSMFFDVEFDYRMFAMVIASNATAMSRNGMTPSFAEKLIENSYNTLPEDLTDKELANKTLSVFVYHFRLNVNNGTVELDLSGKISAQDYLKNAGLLKIIQ
jgi:hypothetical protein